jgi:hypothetical protein
MKLPTHIFGDDSLKQLLVIWGACGHEKILVFNVKFR